MQHAGHGWHSEPEYWTNPSEPYSNILRTQWNAHERNIFKFPHSTLYLIIHNNIKEKNPETTYDLFGHYEM